MKAISIFVGVLGALCVLDGLAHLMLGAGFLYIPASGAASHVWMRSVVGVGLTGVAAIVFSDLKGNGHGNA